MHPFPDPEPRPPGWADKLLAWYCAPHLLEEVQGDLHEEFDYQVQRVGRRRARLDYIRNVLGFARPFAVKRKPNPYPSPFYSPAMLHNYLLTSCRTLLKTKHHTSITLVGLALGLSCLLLISLYVMNELSYDRFYPNASRTYRLFYELGKPGEPVRFPVLGAGVAGQLKAEFPEIEAATRIRVTGSPLITYGGNTFKEEAFAYVDASFFQVFTLPFLEGDPRAALVHPNSVVITEEMARKYFGAEDPLGKSLQFKSWNTAYQVTGVIRNVPPNAHFHFNFYASMASLPEAADNRWLANTSFYTYVLLPEDYDYRRLETKLPRATEKYLGPEIAQSSGRSFAEVKRSGDLPGLKLQPLTDIHLRSNMLMEIEPNGDIRYVYIFAAVAFFVLLIACVNFVNLSTAGAARRAREVGIRKALGSLRGQLVGQFLTDSFLLTLAAMFLSLAVVTLTLPLVNQLAGKTLSMGMLLQPRAVLGLGGLLLLVALLAGSYPAFYLSAIQPIRALKGQMTNPRQGASLRSGLVVFQFFIAITLMVATLVVHRQLSYMQQKKLGFQKEQVLLISNTYALKANEALFKEQILQLPGVAQASISGYVPINSPNDTNDELRADGTKAGVRIYNVDYDYLPTLSIQIEQGRNFSPRFSTDSTGVLLNESAVQKLGLGQHPVGRTVYKNGEGGKPVAYTVVGVIKNFHFESLHRPIEPLAMFLGHNSGSLLVKTDTRNIAGLLSSLRQKWSRLAPETPFLYAFLDDRFAAVYRDEEKTGQLLTVFALLTVFVACLGLLGLAAFVGAQRTKEIGIRKVLGASMGSIIALLSGEFVKLVLVALLLASPVAWYLMNRWLQDFAYRIDLEWWMFAVAGILAVLIALLTVGFQSVKAALRNPVKSLRSE